MKHLLILGCLGLSFVCSLKAEEPASASPTPVPVPSEPFVEKAPNFSRWTVTNKIVTDKNEKLTPPEASPSTNVTGGSGTHRKKSAAGSAEKAKTDSAENTVLVTKTKSIRLEQTTDGGGTKIERWCVDGIQVTLQGSGTPLVSLVGAANGSPQTESSDKDFDGFDWIAANNFQGIENVMGQECYVFRRQAKPISKHGDVVPEMVAWINTATRLPVMLKQGEEVQTYEFGLAPTAMLILPSEVATNVENWQKSLEQSSLMPAIP